MNDRESRGWKIALLGCAIYGVWLMIIESSNILAVLLGLFIAMFSISAIIFNE